MPKDHKRTDRIAELIRRELAVLIQHRMKDPRVPKLISISDLTVTRDLSHAKVYITQIGHSGSLDEAVTLLNNAAGYFRSELAKSVELRTIPQLHFIHDKTVEEGSRLSKLIDDAIDNDQNQ